MKTQICVKGPNYAQQARRLQCPVLESIGMDFVALATDGDGTLVRRGRMAQRTVAALKRWRASGRKLVLVTGETPQQLSDFPHLDLFDRIVAENGALLISPKRSRAKKLGHAPPARLLHALERAGVSPLRRGNLIIQAELEHEAAITKVLRELKTDWRLIRNRHELMVVPPGVDKASGLAAVLKELKIRPSQVVAIGDAENDGPLLQYCGLGVAVNNAVPKLKRQSTLVTCGKCGQGIAELINRLLAGKSVRPGKSNAKRKRSQHAH